MAQEMLLLELIAQYSPVYPEGGSWEDAAELLYAEDAQLMGELTAALKVEGWRDPILLSVDDGDREDGPYIPRVWDGTHRVAIALREGIISVPTALWGEQAQEPELYLELTVELKGPEAESLSYEEDDRLVTALRSFGLDSATWLNSDIAYGSGWSWSFLYALPEHRSGELIRKVRSRLAKSFPERSFELTAKLEPPYEDQDPTHG